MKKALSSIAGSVSLLLFSSTVAFAASAAPVASEVPVNPCPSGSQFDILCKFGPDKFGPFVGNVVLLLFVIAVLIALGFLIWGGIKWITSGGDKSGVESARNHIVAAIVGLVIVFLAFFIVNIVAGFFIKDFSFTNLKLPTAF
ncbi:MAG: pilin [Patescibacteria group bacterium]|nr:pilin [Patescibacteria group bacterium]